MNYRKDIIGLIDLEMLKNVEVNKLAAVAFSKHKFGFRQMASYGEDKLFVKMWQKVDHSRLQILELDDFIMETITKGRIILGGSKSEEAVVGYMGILKRFQGKRNITDIEYRVLAKNGPAFASANKVIFAVRQNCGQKSD